MAARTGSRNLITDVPGILVGQAEDRAGISGTTVVLAEMPAVASVDVRGGAPGSRETELLAPGTLVNRIDAIVLSGGSAFGLDAAAGVMDWLAEAGRGFAVGSAIVPIVPLRSCSTSASPTAGRGPASRPTARLVAKPWLRRARTSCSAMPVPASAPHPAGSRAGSAAPRSF